MNPELAITVGLPSSGKTTAAREMQSQGWARVCPDDIRLALHGQQFHGPAEPLVWANAELMVRSLLQGGHRVIVDATNTTKKRREPWERIAKDFGLEMQVVFCDVSTEEAKRRNAARDDAIPEEVIDRMAEQLDYREES